MKGMIKIVVLVGVALASFIGYTVLFSVTSGLKPTQALAIFGSQKPAEESLNKDLAAKKTSEKETPAEKTHQKEDSNEVVASVDTVSPTVTDSGDSVSVSAAPDTTKAALDSLQVQLTQIRTEKAELEKLKTELAQLVKTKNKADSAQMYVLAKMYDGVDAEQLASMMSNMNDSLVIVLLPKLKSQKAGKILQAMPPERAAKISSKLLGLN
jgi:flagellar motility protein MotE (MotC chaperone)